MWVKICILGYAELEIHKLLGSNETDVVRNSKTLIEEEKELVVTFNVEKTDGHHGGHVGIQKQE